MAGWIVLIYMIIGLALTIGLELLHVFDMTIRDTNKLYDLELSNISEMFVKGILQFLYLVNWPLLIWMTGIYIYNNWNRITEEG